MEDPQAQTLSIPSLVAFAVVSFLAIRYFFFSSPSSSPSSTSGSSHAAISGRAARRRHNFPPERVDTVASMFPQLNRRDIEWDLVQNGGSAQATTERVLMGGRLPSAPPNFTPLYAAPPPTTSASTSSAQQRGKQNYQDLITRYNLSGRITSGSGTQGDGEVMQTTEKQKEKGGWSSSKAERQALLQRRRDEMILAARRKLEQRDAKGKAAA